jgi:hypothetical protein
VASDPRPRNQSHFAEAPQAPEAIQWANLSFRVDQSLPEEICLCAEADREHVHWDRVCFNHGPSPLCASGGYGSAKTHALCLKALYLCDTFPGNRGIIARKIAKELERTTQSTFYKICPPSAYASDRGGRRADSENYLRLANGSEILWLHLDDEDIEGVLRGLEINWFLIDQAEEIEEELFDHLVSRLGRWDKARVPEHLVTPDWEWRNPVTGSPQVPTYALLACNPDTYMHWIYRRFHPDSPEHWERKTPEMDNLGKPSGRLLSYHDMGYRMITLNSLENKFLPAQNRQYMLQRDESFQRRFVRGQWGIPEGQIHEIDPMSILEGDLETIEWIGRNSTIHRSMDHGESSPTCCLWFATDGIGNVICFREYYQPNKLISYHREAITELSKDERVTFNLADPSIFFLTQQKYGGRWSVADEYSDISNLPRTTAIFWTPADNNELGTRNRINEYLRVDSEHKHPLTGVKGAPRLYFVKKSDEWPQGCYHAIQQLKSQRHERVGTELGKPIFSDDRDESIPDHAYDPVRYMIASRPPVAVGPVKQYAPGSFEQVRQNMLTFKRTGGFRRLRAEAARRRSGMA